MSESQYLLTSLKFYGSAHLPTFFCVQCVDHTRGVCVCVYTDDHHQGYCLHLLSSTMHCTKNVSFKYLLNSCVDFEIKNFFKTGLTKRLSY